MRAPCTPRKPASVTTGLRFGFKDSTPAPVMEWRNWSGRSGLFRARLRLPREFGCECLHVEYDQYPESHVYLIARKPERGRT